MSKVVINDQKTVMVDVDETIILYEDKSYGDSRGVVIKCYGREKCVYKHQPNIDLLKKLHALNYTIIAWSATDGVWAEAACKAVGIDDIITMYMTKPKFYVDDLHPEKWMGHNLYKDPMTGKEVFE